MRNKQRPQMTNARDKYAIIEPMNMPDRQWPSTMISRAPRWCSVDLRDGNQALHTPMNPSQKDMMMSHLLAMGFKEIEVGFPAASQTDFKACRMMIENGMIPDDVTIQVLTQSTPHLIERTMEGIRGAKSAIVHQYISTSTLQRAVVLRKTKTEIIDMAINSAQQIRDIAETMPETDVVLQFSPESFTGTELPYAKDICEAVMETWGASPERQMIINLPATVENTPPNVYADKIEWFARHTHGRENYILSVHTHNDRGTGIAAAEMAMMAGAERVEGTLFGNGERSGNADLIIMARNLYAMGIDPQINISNVMGLREMYEKCTGMEIPVRHPVAGDLAFSAFSGSHQDAIRKGLASCAKYEEGRIYAVPYIPVDPEDIGRGYEGIIRINSQSGKSGVAYVMKQEHSLIMPRSVEKDFAKEVQAWSDGEGKEVSPADMWEILQRAYLEESPVSMTLHKDERFQNKTNGSRSTTCVVEATISSVHSSTGQIASDRVTGEGNGPVAAFVNAVQNACGVEISITSFNEHAIAAQRASPAQAFKAGQEEKRVDVNARAVAYVEAEIEGKTVYGIGISEDTTKASMNAVVSAMNRRIRQGGTAFAGCAGQRQPDRISKPVSCICS